jgi:hypothetical protein
MAEDQGSAELTTTDARQATKEGVVRYVLGISLASSSSAFSSPTSSASGGDRRRDAMDQTGGQTIAVLRRPSRRFS